MDKKKVSKAVAERAVKVLNASLRTEANSTTCFALYQPKAPESLSRFKRK